MTKKFKNRQELYYITHIDNLPSILEKGIFCNDIAEKKFQERKKIANKDIIEKRKKKGLTKYANLYIHPRNPMLYQIYKNLKWKVIILGVDASIITKKDTKISIGNAAADNSIMLVPQEVNVNKLFKEIRNIKYWYGEPLDISNFIKDHYYHPMDLKKLIMSEVLVPRKIPKKYIASLYVPTEKAKEKVLSFVPDIKFPVAVEPTLFFDPIKQEEITENLTIVYGDMFFSSCDVLTISVNTVGIMGKGLASKFRYMYPQGFVQYQDLCKKKKIKIGEPQLIYTSNNGTPNKFLLFPTKKHWRENSKLEYIEQGLDYLIKQIKTGHWKIKSIAFPALGCGLGNLSWETVGPVMAKKLEKLKNIPIELYVPENKNQYFKKEFYLK